MVNEERVICQEWGSAIREINSICHRENCLVKGIPMEPEVVEIGINTIANIFKNIDGGIALDDYIIGLQDKYNQLNSVQPKVVDNYDAIEAELKLTEEAIAELEEKQRGGLPKVYG